MISIDNKIFNNQTVRDEDFLDYALSHGFGDIHFKVDPVTGMKAMIAIHSIKLGPALGGCRFIEYPNIMAAIKDVMRLARGMSYKAASVDLPLGGGKAVIIKPKTDFDRTAYMHEFGKFVNELNGKYITALDSGTVLEDMDIIAEHTPYVASLAKFGGDPSPYTATGVLRGIEAAVAFKLGKESLSGLDIAIQGIGHVGYPLAKKLYEMGANLTVADTSIKALELAKTELGATVVSIDSIHKVPCDVFSPCALGAILNDTSINELQTQIIAGAANNQLAQTHHGMKLHEKGILYAPDYVINAGGLILAASKYLDYSDEVMDSQLNNIYTHLMEIFQQSAKENLSTSEIADKLAQEKIGQI